MPEKLRGAVIGCGSVGALKPEFLDSPQTSFPLTHAHAYSMHPDFELAWVADIDEEKGFEACKRWECHSFIGPEWWQKADGQTVDVVSICTPDETHREMVALAIERIKPKMIICEKPMGTGLEDARAICGIVRSELHPLIERWPPTDSPALAVNYTRRFVPELRRPWRPDESPIMAFFHYGRGLRRDGCHAVDLALQWFGEFHYVMPNYRVYEDTCGQTITRWAQFAFCPVIFNATPSKAYSVFDADIWTNQGLIQVRENGLRIERRAVAPEGRYGAYPALKAYTGEPTITGLPWAMLRMLDNVRDHIREGSPLLCTGRDAVEVWRAIEEMERKP